MIAAETGFKPPETWGIALVIAAIAGIGYGLTALAERILVPWAPQERPMTAATSPTGGRRPGPPWCPGRCRPAAPPAEHHSLAVEVGQADGPGPAQRGRLRHHRADPVGGAGQDLRGHALHRQEPGRRLPLPVHRSRRRRQPGHPEPRLLDHGPRHGHRVRGRHPGRAGHGQHLRPAPRGRARGDAGGHDPAHRARWWPWCRSSPSSSAGA